MTYWYFLVLLSFVNQSCSNKKPKTVDSKRDYGYGSGEYYDSLNQYDRGSNGYNNNNNSYYNENQPYGQNFNSQYPSYVQVAAENITTGDSISALSTYIFAKANVENEIRFFVAQPFNQNSNYGPANNSSTGQVSRLIISGFVTPVRQIGLDRISFMATPGLFGQRSATVKVCAVSSNNSYGNNNGYGNNSYGGGSNMPPMNGNISHSDCGQGEIAKDFFIEAPSQGFGGQQGNGYFGQQGGAYQQRPPGIFRNFFEKLTNRSRSQVQVPSALNVSYPYTNPSNNSQSTDTLSNQDYTSSSDQGSSDAAKSLQDDPINPLLSLSSSRLK